MAPSEKEISDTIRATVRSMFNGPDRENLTVNNIRDQVETILNLKAGFLKQGSWKQESKDIVKTESGKLLDIEEAGTAPHSINSTPAKPKPEPVKNDATETIKQDRKRSPNGNGSQVRKRQKREDTPTSKDADSDSALTPIEDTSEEGEDDYFSDVPKSRKPTKSTARSGPKSLGKPKIVEQKKEKKTETVVAEGSTTPDPRLAKKAFGKGKSEEKDNRAPSGKSKELSSGDKREQINRSIGGGDIESDSEMSVVLDEPPKRKKKSKVLSNAHSSTSNIRSSKSAKATKSHVQLSPDETELKTLQSQLVMCGVRKIWGVILKDYGSDTKAKIRHLKGMLKDVGMEGRFSKQKAEEIKEARELQADLEAVKEGEAIWGMRRGARSQKGSSGKKIAELTDEEEDVVTSRSGNSSGNPPARVARAKMDLAFLGDESDSDD